MPTSMIFWLVLKNNDINNIPYQYFHSVMKPSLPPIPISTSERKVIVLIECEYTLLFSSLRTGSLKFLMSITFTIFLSLKIIVFSSYLIIVFILYCVG